MDAVPYGYCACRCGQKTTISPASWAQRGWVRGEPRRFVNGHNARSDDVLRFEARINRAPGQGPHGTCHEWTGSLNANGGYGQCFFHGTTRLAHRVAWFLATGAWPSQSVLHHCDNPLCVRYECLFEGTQADNMTDMTAKGRRARGEVLSKLTAQQVAAIRRLRGVEFQRVTAERYGVSQTAVGKIQRGERWAA